MAQKRDLYQIGILAKEARMSVEAVRFYERSGLLQKPARSEGGFRLYPSETIQKIRFIKKAQDLGLTLKEIKGIMQCSEDGIAPCCDLVRKLFAKKINEFESKIGELQRMKTSLEELLSQWISPKEARKKSFSVCPQIESTTKSKKGVR